MKKIMLSLFTIAAVAVLATGATSAYFSDHARISTNTFSTGTVKIGNMSSTHLNVANLEPGVWTQGYNVDVPYIGSLNADLYAAAYGAGTVETYLGDQLTVQILNKDTGVVAYQGLTSGLSHSWASVAANVGPNSWNHFSLAFYLDPLSEKQGVLNNDTYFLLYAVQHNGPAPLDSAIPGM